MKSVALLILTRQQTEIINEEVQQEVMNKISPLN